MTVVVDGVSPAPVFLGANPARVDLAGRAGAAAAGASRRTWAGSCCWR